MRLNFHLRWTRALKTYTTLATVYCLEALKRGVLVKDARPSGAPRWQFGQRHFSNQTVGKIIAAGIARREGNRVLLNLQMQAAE